MGKRSSVLVSAGLYSKKRCASLLLKYLGVSPVLKIMDLFFDNPLSDYSKNEIVKNLEMGRVTIFQILVRARKIRRCEGYQASWARNNVPAGQEERSSEAADQARYGSCQKGNGKGCRGT